MFLCQFLQKLIETLVEACTILHPIKLISESRLRGALSGQLSGPHFVDSGEHLLFRVCRGMGALCGKSADLKIHRHLRK